MIAVAMVSKVFLFRFDLLYPLHIIIGAGALWFYRKRIPVRWEASWSAIGLGFFVFAIWIMLAHGTKDAARDAAIGSGLRSLPVAAGFLWMLFRLAGAVAVVPIAEELAYRGYLMRRLVSADFESVALTHFTWLSFLGSSILFGVLHSQWIPGTLAGMIFAFAVYRYGSLSDGIVSHMTANALLAAYVLMTGHWFLWN
jgi:CAAX prenyl protease-like protein